MKTETISFNTEGGDTTAYVAMPHGGAGEKSVIVIQEYWGLNDHIKDIAGRYAEEGFVAIAPDLYRGALTSSPKEASELMGALDIDDGLDTINKCVEEARARYGLSHFGITGYCMGGTFALRAACELEGFSAAAPFYGDIPPEDVLKRLTTPTIFISGRYR